MAPSYWSKLVDRRLSRRRMMAATTGAAFGAAFLAACGSDDGGTPTTTPTGATGPAPTATGSTGAVTGATGPTGAATGLLHTPVDSTGEAKAGGTIRHFATADITTFDSLANNGSAPLSMSAVYAYPRLVKYSLVKYPEMYEAGSFTGDLAESWEVSGDRLQITFKLRQGVKWDPRPPTESRVADAQDVMASWEKFTAVNPGASTFLYNAETAPSAPIERLEAPDNSTIIVRLREPDASTIAQFAGTTFSPMPREFDGGFDPQTTVRGHGPWMLEDYVPSSRFVWAKNPNYYIQGRPFPDRIEVPIVPEYASRLAQFRAGNIHTDVVGGFGGGQADIMPTKRDLPQTNLLVADTYPTQAAWMFSFGYDGNAPFKDQRMRQAASMLIDREGYIDAIDNRDGFAKDGLDLDAAYGTVVAAGWTGFWLDPKNQGEFGENAKYLHYNMEEAKKLIDAAGMTGVEFDFHYNASPQFPIQGRIVELFNAMLLDGGLNPKLNGITSPQEYQDNYYYGYQRRGYIAGTKKGYGGIAMGQERPFATVALLVFGTLHKDGAFYHGMTPTGENPEEGDPMVNDLAEKIKQEFDLPTQQRLVHELVRYFTGQSYYVPQVSQAKAFTLWWPIIGNLGAYSNGVSPNLWTERHLHWWIDSTKPPRA